MKTKKLKLKKKQEKGTLCYYWISCCDYLELYDKRRESLYKNCDWSNKVQINSAMAMVKNSLNYGAVKRIA